MRNGIIVFLLLVATVIAGGSGVKIDRGITDSRFKDLAETNTSATRTVDDAIPRVAMRFDDGRANIWGYGNAENAELGATCQLQAFLRRGIPVTLALNTGYTTSRGDSSGKRLTWAELREIRDYAAEHGAEIEFANHGNTNLAGLLTGGYENLINEFTTTLMSDSLGVTPTLFLQPGDDYLREGTRRHRDVIEAVLDSLGYKFAQICSGTDLDSLPQNFCRVGRKLGSELAGKHNISDDGMTTFYMGSMKPGMLTHKYTNRSVIVGDMGAMAVERHEDQASNATTWLFSQKTEAEDDLTDGERETAYEQTFAHLYSSLLADNMGFCIAFHDSLDSDGDDYSTAWGLDEEATNGYTSPEHVAWTLKALEDAGHIVLCTQSEFMEWASSYYKPGLDLIENPQMIIPQYDIADTFGFQYAWPRGLSSVGTRYTTADANFYNTMLPLNNLDEATADDEEGKFDINHRDPTDYFGPGTATDGYGGMPGGLEVPASGGEPRDLQLSWGNLQPGRYRFSVAIKWIDTGGISISGIMNSFSLRSQFAESGWELEGAQVYGDTLIHWLRSPVTSATVNDPPTDSREDWHVFGLDFHLPHQPPGDTFASPFWGNSAGEMGHSSDRVQYVVSGSDTLVVSTATVTNPTGNELVYTPEPATPYLFTGGNERIWLLNDILWAISLQMDLYGNVVLSYPQLRYLGP